MTPKRLREIIAYLETLRDSARNRTSRNQDGCLKAEATGNYTSLTHVIKCLMLEQTRTNEI